MTVPNLIISHYIFRLSTIGDPVLDEIWSRSEVTSWTARQPSRVSIRSYILVVTFSHQSINQFNI